MSQERKKHFFKTVSQDAKKTYLSQKAGEKGPEKGGKGKGTPKKSKNDESGGNSLNSSSTSASKRGEESGSSSEGDKIVITAEVLEESLKKLKQAESEMTSGEQWVYYLCSSSLERAGTALDKLARICLEAKKRMIRDEILRDLLREDKKDKKKKCKDEARNTSTLVNAKENGQEESRKVRKKKKKKEKDEKGSNSEETNEESKQQKTNDCLNAEGGGGKEVIGKGPEPLCSL